MNRKISLPALWIFSAVVLYAATQGPDAAGYSGTDAGIYSFVDISGGGSASVLSGTDDGAAPVVFPFPFTFYGVSYSHLCVTPNGAAYFFSGAAVCPAISDFVNTDLTSGAPPADYPAVLPFWSDLTFQTPGAGSVCYQTLGVAPNRRLVLQWNLAFPQGSASPVTFEVIFSESSNAVTFQYKTVLLGGGDPAGGGALATVGVRAMNGYSSGQQLQWSYSAPVLNDSLALLFTPGAGPLPPVLASPANGSASVALPVSLSWAASAGTASYDVYFGTASPPAFAASVNGTSYSPVGVSAATTYNWQIVAKNGAGSNASVIRSFTTAAAAAGGGGGGDGGGGSALSVQPDSLTISAAAGGPLSTQTVTLTYQTYTEGAPAWNSTRTTNQGFGWLSVSPAAGTMTLASYAGFLYTYTATVAVNVDPAGIAVGNSYNGTVSFSSGGGIAQLPVTMNVVSQPAVFSANPAALTFTYSKADGKLPATQSIAVTSKPAGAALTVAASAASGGNWLSASSSAATAPAAVSFLLNGSVVANLAPGTYTGKVTLSGATATSLDIPVTLNVGGPDSPAISTGGVVPVYGSTPNLQSGAWASIFGNNLAASTAVWDGQFPLPTTLGDVSVAINGKPAFLWFVSQGQINFQAPDDTATGTVNVVVTTATGSATSTVTLAKASPSLSLLDTRYPAAIVITSSGYDVIGPVGRFPYNTRLVRKGETLILYGVGFGPTDPAVPAGQPPDGAANCLSNPSVTIGGVDAKVAFCGIVAAGLYQINLVVPDNVGSGDQPIAVSAYGLQTQTNLFVAVE
jgi:uncharacterized protein (TIGR03437 family)